MQRLLKPEEALALLVVSRATLGHFCERCCPACREKPAEKVD
jgi:hypothetical protein